MWQFYSWCWGPNDWRCVVCLAVRQLRKTKGHRPCPQMLRLFHRRHRWLAGRWGGGTQTVVTSSDHAGGKLPRKQLTQHGYQLSPWRLPPCTGITEPVTQNTAYLIVGKSRRHPKGRKGNMLCARKDSQLVGSPAWPRCSSLLGMGRWPQNQGRRPPVESPHSHSPSPGLGGFVLAKMELEKKKINKIK